MRVLNIINNLGSGGAEKLILDSLPLMNKIEGIKADVLLLTDKNNVFDKKLEKNGVKINLVPLKKIYSPSNIFYIRKYIIRGNYDIVHAHIFPTSYWVSIASKLIFKNRPKFILTEHSTHNKRRERPYFKYIERFIYSSYDRVISISQKTQENLVAWIKSRQKNSNKFVIIENGIDLIKFRSAQSYKKSEINNKFSESTKLICMIGRFSKIKDQKTLIKAMKNLTEDIHLLLIGEGNLLEENKELARELGIYNRVHFLGFRDDIDRILKTVDIVVMSSKWEGFGLAAVEGMASGKPVIASDVPGLREVVENAGILFTMGDSEQLGEKIKNLIENQVEYNKISQRCYERANCFSIERMVKAYIRVYQDSI